MSPATRNATSAGAVTLQVAARGRRAYPVVLGPGVQARLPELVPPGTATIALLADTNVAPRHAAAVGQALQAIAPVEQLGFPAGEGHKTRETKARLEDELLARGCGRDTLILGLGGGVTTDLAGFLASTYLRGVPWLALPTSLLAAVDASVGGKTGVNTPAGKNLVGTFYEPWAVCIDLHWLATLPAAEVDNGLAEMVKHAVLADAAYLDRLVASAPELRALAPEAVGPAIQRSLEIKAEVVTADPTEANRREVLNLGHTIGHAIEAVSGYTVSHGRAVAAGLAVEADIAVRLDLLDAADRTRLGAALDALALPTGPPAGTEPAALLAALTTDKKRRRGRVRFALPTGLGDLSPGPDGYAREVPEDVLRSVLEEATR